MNEATKNNLGRGLDALLGDDPETAVDVSRETMTVPVTNLEPSPYQPRHHFDEESLSDLVESVRSKGVIQPLLVREREGMPGHYEIIAGERRWRASQLAGAQDVPVIVKEMNNQEVLEVALIENLQRQDLSALEEAKGYKRLMEEFAHTQEALGQAVGKSRSHVANTMRLLSLPDEVQEMLEIGKLSAGHARTLLTVPEPVLLAEEIIKKGLNVRQAEKLAQKSQDKPQKKAPKAKEKDPDTIALEQDLTNLLGLQVDIKFKGRGGEISFQFDTLAQLDNILGRLGQGGQVMEQGATAPLMAEEEDDWEKALGTGPIEPESEDDIEEESDEDADGDAWAKAMAPDAGLEEVVVETDEDLSFDAAGEGTPLPEDVIEEVFPDDDLSAEEKEMLDSSALGKDPLMEDLPPASPEEIAAATGEAPPSEEAEADPEPIVSDTDAETPETAGDEETQIDLEAALAEMATTEAETVQEATPADSAEDASNEEGVEEAEEEPKPIPDIKKAPPPPVKKAPPPPAAEEAEKPDEELNDAEKALAALMEDGGA